MIRSVLILLLFVTFALGAEPSGSSKRIVSQPDKLGSYWVEYSIPPDYLNKKRDEEALPIPPIPGMRSTKRSITFPPGYSAPIIDSKGRMLQIHGPADYQKAAEALIRGAWGEVKKH